MLHVPDACLIRIVIFPWPCRGSKLASLFNVDQSVSQGGNESLKYTAPKEPKKKKKGEGSGGAGAGTSSLLCAAAVHAYK